jgi:hypothetical protein
MLTTHSMKKALLVCAIASLAGVSFAAEADDVKAAAKKLAANNYSWTSTVKGGRFAGSTDGKADKDGQVWLSMVRGENTIKAVLKGDKGAAQLEGEWRALSEMADSNQSGPGTFVARVLRAYKAPAAEAEDLAGKTRELKKEGDVYSAELTDEAAQGLLTFRGMRASGDTAPTAKNAKGSVKFWVKDGQLAKYEYNVEGTVTFNNEDRDVDRTTTTEIKDVGSTKVEVPEEAKKKLL